MDPGGDTLVQDPFASSHLWLACKRTLKGSSLAHIGALHLFRAILGLVEMGSKHNSEAKDSIITEVEHLFEALSSRPRQVRFCDNWGCYA
jgi:hypothetical protein